MGSAFFWGISFCIALMLHHYFGFREARLSGYEEKERAEMRAH